MTNDELVLNTTHNKNMSARFRASFYLSEALGFPKCPQKYLGTSGGDHIIMVGGYYYAVDLVCGTARQTA